jgi:hypothetical protein
VTILMFATLFPAMTYSQARLMISGLATIFSLFFLYSERFLLGENCILLLCIFFVMSSCPRRATRYPEVSFS